MYLNNYFVYLYDYNTILNTTNKYGTNPTKYVIQLSYYRSLRCW